MRISFLLCARNETTDRPKTKLHQQNLNSQDNVQTREIDIDLRDEHGNTSMQDGLQVCNIDMNHMVLPTTYTKDDFPVSSTRIPKNDELSKWPHLNGVRLPNWTNV